MAVIRNRITVNPPVGETVTVDILEDDVSVGTAHAERTTSRTLTLPLEITSRTSFFLPRDGGPYEVSVKLNDVEIAGPGGTTVTASSFPTEVNATLDVAELGTLEGSGGSSAALGDFVTWTHSGAGAPDSGNYDYAADITASRGSTITYDDSTDWVNAYGYTVGKVIEAGTYAFRGGAAASVSFYDGTAAPITPWSSGPRIKWLPANAHFEVSLDGDPSELTVERVA